MTLFLWDWDNTLMPTQYLRDRGIISGTSQLTPKETEILHQIEACLLQLLDIALTLGRVYIVTNAEIEWIPLSVQTFLPQLEFLLPQLTLISAKTKYERMYPDNQVLWKTRVFQDILNEQFFPVQLIGLGDLDTDWLSWQQAFSHRSTQHKFIRMVMNPTLTEIRDELDLLVKTIQTIVEQPGDGQHQICKRKISV